MNRLILTTEGDRVVVARRRFAPPREGVHRDARLDRAPVAGGTR